MNLPHFADLPHRHTARVLLLDADNRFCLLRCRDDLPIDPAMPRMIEYWSTPGGGLEPGESHEACALRELGEELGIDCARICGAIASWRKPLLCRGRLTLVVERLMVARLPSGAPATLDLGGLTGDERRWVREARWWRLAETPSCELPIMLPPLGELVRAAGVFEEVAE
jgi:8-oxo-dGTP pyrophosphatase MutT (NUDIX family)